MEDTTDDILKKGKISPKKYCPFCGGAPEGKKEKTEEAGTVMHYVECMQCHSRTKSYRYLASAITRWDSQIYDTKWKCGEWLYKEDDEGQYIECSVCGQQYGATADEEVVYAKFCSECGARLIQQKQTGERKISLCDQLEGAERIKHQKKEKDRVEKVEIYRKREIAEGILKRMISVEDDQEDLKTTEID
ncbi:MAG: hypothetical protein IJY52_08490 [Anaerotignum sp.]|nr:hypothetical protein [Anaerotignum sp.]